MGNSQSEKLKILNAEIKLQELKERKTKRLDDVLSKLNLDVSLRKEINILLGRDENSNINPYHATALTEISDADIKDKFSNKTAAAVILGLKKTIYSLLGKPLLII